LRPLRKPRGSHPARPPKRLGLDVGENRRLHHPPQQQGSVEALWSIARPVVPILDEAGLVAEACDVIDAIVERKSVIPRMKAEPRQARKLN
jgi:hypothetical protein